MGWSSVPLLSFVSWLSSSSLSIAVLAALIAAAVLIASSTVSVSILNKAILICLLRIPVKSWSRRASFSFANLQSFANVRRRHVLSEGFIVLLFPLSKALS